MPVHLLLKLINDIRATDTSVNDVTFEIEN